MQVIREINTKTNEFGDPTDPAIEVLIRAVYTSHFYVWLHNYSFQIFLT